MTQAFVKATMNESVRTENGAVTYNAHNDPVLSVFGHGGALRGQEERRILNFINDALNTDFNLALRAIFHIGDIRGGQGERQFMRYAVKQLATLYPNKVNATQLLLAIEEYSRFDVILELLDTPLETQLGVFISERLEKDLKTEYPSLLAKWLPSANSRNTSTRNKGRKIAKLIGVTEKEYRKTLSKLRKQIGIVETLVTEGRWGEIELDKVPGVALKRYSTLFNEKIPTKMEDFFAEAERALEAGEKSNLKTNTLYPHDILSDVFSRNIDSKQGDLLWKSLPDYVKGHGVLSVIDASASMGSFERKGSPMNIAMSLGLYTSERLSDAFKDHYINFNDAHNTKMLKFIGNDLLSKCNSLNRRDWGWSTDVQAVFDLVLRTATKNNLTQEDMPKSIVIFSDMEFNSCGENTNLVEAQRKFADAGYVLPNLVFWNVESRNDQSPVQADSSGAVLVSGYSPVTLQFVLSGATKTPYDLMLDVIGTSRYDLAESIAK